MESSGCFSKAYIIEDRLRFMDEAMSTYKDMLRREVSSACRYGKCQDKMAEKNLFSPMILEHSFKDWLESTLRGGDEISRVHRDLNIRGKLDAEVCVADKDIPSPTTSVMTNYGGSRFSFSSSLEQFSESQLHVDSDTFLGEYYNKNETYLHPLRFGGCTKSRTGSWSDSGYSCDKSDSENSRFSSLSYGGCFDVEDERNEQLSEKYRHFEDENNMADFERESVDKLYEHFSGLQKLDDDQYNPEELKVFRELMNNPENFHETTKELSDMARDVSSKRKHSKTLSGINRFFRKLVKNVRKFSTDKGKDKYTRKEYDLSGECGRKIQRRWSIRSCPSPLQKRNCSAKTNGMFGLAINSENSKNIQRTNSYSSLFGRKGSLFSHIERNEDLHVAERSESCDVMRQTNLTDGRNFIDFRDIETMAANSDTESFVSKQMDDLQSRLTRLCPKDESCRKVNSRTDVNSRIEHGDRKFGDCELVAPLKVSVSEERSAHMRRIRKLSDDVFN